MTNVVKITNLLTNAIHFIIRGERFKKWQKRCTVRTGRYGTYHRVDRVLGFFSSRPSVSPPRNQRGRGTHSLAGVGLGVPHPGSDEGTDTVVL
jgi:hypothetical protein